ncbi:uncharacterized protein PADG_06831 [Paracoccidioides brasiliensis Pb18]|uniref:N-acetyltransferase domain-containing protein n=1 Tax=Paracoccidioides brasiliensis (strain Pb18) TaxID=502780 RepID=C1GHU5_PARBD|nr:uncharacterized protein PADG_06831 [Paracoccidioides brasiliensis Pb18]EEH50752.2 hypothetical protein PADG_06831 [Paracoccidioides brasiliensis Pb18]
MDFWLRGSSSKASQVPNIAIPAQSNTAATISPAVNVSLRDGASQRTNVIRNTKSSNPRHLSSECQPPIRKIHPTFAGAEDSVQKKSCVVKILTHPKDSSQSPKSPKPDQPLADLSDEFRIRRHRRFIGRSPLDPSSPDSLRAGRLTSYTIQNLRQDLNTNSSATINRCEANSNKATNRSSPTAHQGTHETPNPDRASKFLTSARNKERTAPMVSNMQVKSSAGGAKKMDINERLERLQREEKRKIGLQRRGINIYATKKESSALDIAREGEGNDPKSPVAKGIPSALTNPNIAASSPTKQNERLESNSPIDTELNNPSSGILEYRSPYSVHSFGSSEQKEKKQLVPVDNTVSSPLVNSQYRPWDSQLGSEFTHRFTKWLGAVRTLDRVCVDTTSPLFNDANLRSDGGHEMIVSKAIAPITLLNLADPESAEHVHKTARGYIHNWNARIDREQEGISAKREKMALHMKLAFRNPQPLAVEANSHTPKAKKYIRPVEKKDFPGLLYIFNWYVQNTVSCVDLDKLSVRAVKERVDECEREKFPTLVAVEQKPRLGHALSEEKENIYGYILSSDFTGPATINRYTAELELFVDPKYYRLGVGKCLLDKMLEILDGDYTPYQGYHFDCAAAQADVHRGGRNRRLSRLIFIIHHKAEDDSNYRWTKERLERRFGFEEQALLKGTGYKMGEW